MDENDKPLSRLTEVERKMEAPVEPAMSTHERLRAFEDKNLGKEAPRHDGKVERGSGSAFSRMSVERKAHHAAIEALIEAEHEHSAATAAMEAADRKLDAAVKRVEETSTEND